MIEEKEFKKLASNSRDWLLYQLLSERSKEIIKKELQKVDGSVTIGDTVIKSEHVSGVNIEEQEKQAPKGETSVVEIVTGKVTLITDKAVLIGVGDRVAWFPKSVIENLDKIVLKQGETVELIIKDWFKYKIEWKVPTQ